MAEFIFTGYNVELPQAVRGSTLRKRRAKASMLMPSMMSDYWDQNVHFYSENKCHGEMVYSSQADHFLKSPEEFNKLYSNIITLRQAELAHILRRIPSCVRRYGVYLIGSSEGAIVLSSFQDESFADYINGRVIIAYPCEPNYWTYFRPEDEGIKGDREIPTLNMIGTNDQYFACRESVASKVAQAADLPPVQGHAFQAMVDAELTHGMVCHFEGSKHTLLLTHDSVVREILTDFLQRPRFACRKLPLHWERIPELQTKIRRFMRKMDKATGTSVMYMRVCAPKTGTVQKVLTEKPELLKRIDLILYQPKGGDKAKQKGAQSPQTMESILPSIMQAVHSDANVPMHTCLAISTKQPEFVAKMEDKLEVLLGEPVTVDNVETQIHNIESVSETPMIPLSNMSSNGTSNLNPTAAPPTVQPAEQEVVENVPDGESGDGRRWSQV